MIVWPLSSLQQTDVNNDLFKCLVTMETIYKSIPAIHTDEHWVCKRKERRKEGERERGEKMMG